MNVPQVSLLTAGRDRPYALGLAAALAQAGVRFDFIGSDDVDDPSLRQSPQIRVLNLRGDQAVNVSLPRKIARVLAYYARLIRYALCARPKIFHILWNNKFEWFDRTLLMLFYRLLGKKIILTVHNVNTRARDGGDSWFNRATLRFQYRCCHHLFVHTEKMRAELISQFAVAASRVSVIPFGLNSTVPDTALTPAAARQRLGLAPAARVILFFGNIAPYKGVEFLVDAFFQLAAGAAPWRLIIAGRPKGNEAYWAGLAERIHASPLRDKFLLKIEFVPDAETEIYFKAADVLVLPYTHIFQSGVLFLGYNFGLPAIAANVGSLQEEIIPGRTGSVVPPRDPAALALALAEFFDGDLPARPEATRRDIRAFARERYSWAKVAALTTAVYAQLAR